MLSERQISIIVYLLNKKTWISGEDLASYVSVKRKTLVADVEEIKSRLGKECVIESSRKGYRLIHLSNSARQQMIQKINGYGEASLRFRTSLIITYLMFLKDYISMQELGDVFFMSKTAISLELGTIRRWISQYTGLTLDISKKKGIRLLAEESVMRISLAKFATAETFRSLPFGHELPAMYERSLQSAESVIQEALSHYGLVMSGETKRRIIRYYAVSILRSQLGYIREPKPVHIPQEEARFWKSSMQRHFGLDGFSDAETDDFRNIFHACDYLGIPSFDDVLLQDMERCISLFLQKAKDLLGISDPCSFDVASAADYLRSMELRSRIGFVAVNNLTERIIERYPLSSYLTSRFFKESFGRELSWECSYLSIQLGACISRFQKKASILLVTNFNESVLAGIRSTLFQIAPTAEITGVLPDYLFKQPDMQKKSYDLFLTTEMNVVLQDPSFYYISPIMSRKELIDFQSHMDWIRLSIVTRHRESILSQYFHAMNAREEDIHLLQERCQSDPAEIIMHPRNKILIIRIKPKVEPDISEYRFSHSISFGSAKVRSILSVSYPEKQKGFLEFFEAVSYLLTNC